MNEDTKEVQSNSDENTSQYLNHGIDPHLQLLVSICTNYENEIHVTLTVGGIIISGSISSGAKYMKHLGDSLSGGDSESPLSKVYERQSQSFNEEQIEIGKFHYIHLKDAKFFATNGKSIPSSDGVWWRGKISDVQGFSLGKITVS